MDFQSFLNQAAGTVGVSTDDAGSAASGILELIQDKVSADDSSALLKALPGASDFLGGRQSQSSPGGLGGSLLGAVGGILGGKAGSALSVLSIFQNANMDTSQAGSFMGLFMDLVANNADDGLVGRILEQIPDLKNLLGK